MTAIGWRFAVIGGCAAGLAASAAPGVASRAAPPHLLVAALLSGAVLCGLRSRRGAPLWLVLVALAAAAGGLALGTWRLAAIDAGGLDGPTGARATATGFVTGVPHRSDGEVSVRVETAQGRLAVEAREPVPDLSAGVEVVARGVIREPAPWEADYLARDGIRAVLRAGSIEPTGGRRGGIQGLVDGIRNRAAAALESGTPAAQAALLRGFLLGEDDRIDPSTVDDFERSGLAHLLAVSGDCVMLLAILGAWLLGLLGVGLRARLLALLGLIAVYVPVAGAAPSIQRAGIMGAAGVVALLAGRPRWRWYALLLAALLTLLLNPRSIADPAWQLSFAAVVGILLFAARIRDVVLALGARGSCVHVDDLGAPPPVARRALAEGVGVTIAATVATAPLFAQHFGAVSLASLPANLLALPAVPAMMWIGMLAAMLGQVPGAPIEPLSWLAGVLAAYVAQIAHWLAIPDWAQVGLSLPSWPAVAAAYAALWAAMETAVEWASRRATAGLRPRAAGAVALAAAIALVGLVLPVGVAPGAGDHGRGLRIVVLDVGQGDAILLEPPGGDPVLVDGGPPGDDLEADLRDEGVSGLAAAVVTHDQSDHVAGIERLLYDGFPIDRLLYAEPSADLLHAARAAHVPALQVGEGSGIDSGGLHLDVLWPPGTLLGAQGLDANQTGLVLLARWRSFAMLLAADAEAEAVPIDPGPIDVLKVAHHGSADAGLDALLARSVPRLAVISAGAENPYGHPAPETLAALADHGTPVLRTDQDGDVTIEVTSRGWSVATG